MAECLADTRSYNVERSWNPWRMWDSSDPKRELDTIALGTILPARNEVIDEVHSISVRMTNFILDAPHSGMASSVAHSAPCASHEGVANFAIPGSFNKTQSSTYQRRFSAGECDQHKNAIGDSALTSPQLSLAHCFASPEITAAYPSFDHLTPFPDQTSESVPWALSAAIIQSDATVGHASGTVARTQCGTPDIWGPPSVHSSPGQSESIHSFTGLDVWETAAGVEMPSPALGQNVCNNAIMNGQPLAGAVRKNDRGEQRRNSFFIKSIDIDRGLCLSELELIPSINGHKQVRFYSQATRRRTVISIIDTAYLMAQKPEIGEIERPLGFVTFHDCVELRSLKTGVTLTRNQRNNLRKRLAMTAEVVVQIDHRQLAANLYSGHTYSHGAANHNHHHVKINAYLLTASVAQVILCTRETTQCFKGQSLAVQTLFDLCKNENAGGALREFIRSQSDLDLNVRDFKGMCPVHYAAKGGFNDAVAALIDAGVDVNVMDKSDQCPLHYAIYNGHKEVQFQLLEAGAVLTRSNISGNTLLHVAAYHNQIDIAQAILARSPTMRDVRNHKFNSTPLQCALHKGLTDMAKLLEP